VASLRQTPRLLVQAPPGSGKTTRLPRALLDAQLPATGDILVLEPRRLAARAAAARVAFELGEPVGRQVGYQVRFEEVSSPQTRVRFLTEGVLLKRLLSQPELKGVGAVLLDEIHERHLHGDTALALLLHLQRTRRPDLLLVAMSATLDGQRIATFLDAPLLCGEGRTYDVTVSYLPAVDERPLERQVASAVRSVLRQGCTGHILVFLPGAHEIRRALNACAAVADTESLVLFPLHGDLSSAEQDRALAPSDQRKVIFATNVAESSVTVDGVGVVIDSGLARTAVYSPWSGISSLRTGPISKASAVQRAGRAGRTRAGHCLRLYTEADFTRRLEFDVPEILRVDLTELALELAARQVHPSKLTWLDAPPLAAWDHASQLLQRLGAVDAAGHITATGRRMVRFPLHPRLSRLLDEADRLGIRDTGCWAAALLAERDIRAPRRALPARSQAGVTPTDSDVLDRVDEMIAVVGSSPARLLERGLDPGACFAVEKAYQHLARLLPPGPPNRQSSRESLCPRPPVFSEDEALRRALLVAFPDRVARRPQVGDAVVVLSGGGSARVGETSTVTEAPFLLAIEAREPVDRLGLARAALPVIHLAAAIEPEWLLELFPDRIRDERSVLWNQAREQVDVIERLLYDGVTLDETRPREVCGHDVAATLAEAALKKGVSAFVDPSNEADRWLARWRFVAALDPTFPPADDAHLRATMTALCAGRRSFAELRASNLIAELEARFTHDQRTRWARWAPERWLLPNGRRVLIEYPRDQAPYMESRLTDFFGVRETPTLAEGRVRVCVHLLAPNGRAVQVTSDLGNFWTSLYPQVRTELRRRYPRHPWPENPLVVPPRPAPAPKR